MKIYGIKSCDSVRKALRFFRSRNIDFETVDFRERPVGCDTIDRWLKKVSIEKLFNKRGAAYRTLKLKEKNLDEAGMREWLCKENILIKRPVIETDDGEVIVGFDEELYKEWFL